MKVSVISANMGGYEAQAVWPTLAAPAGVEIEVHRLTDADLPRRHLAMTPRLKCGLPKMFGHEMFPGADAYVWIDASCTPTPRAVGWFLERLGPKADFALFAHPERRSVREEMAFMADRMARPGESYLTSRYAGEDFDGIWRWFEREAGWQGTTRSRRSSIYADDRLFASTAFAYRASRRPHVAAMLSEWWLTKTRWLLHDQVSLPLLLWLHGCSVSVIQDDYLRCEALTFTRRRGR